MAQVEFRIGPMGGMNFGTISYSPASLDPSATWAGRTGMMVGVQAELGFSNMFYIVLQPSYIEKGDKSTDGGLITTSVINEVEIPVLFKVKFLEGAVRPYAFVGPNFAFVISATGRSIQPGMYDMNLFLHTSSPNLAVDMGGGLEFTVIPNLGITLDARYSLGVSNLVDWGATLGAISLKTKTTKASGFQILVGVMFHIL